jgi:hypothetical protein
MCDINNLKEEILKFILVTYTGKIKLALEIFNIFIVT